MVQGRTEKNNENINEQHDGDDSYTTANVISSHIDTYEKSIGNHHDYSLMGLT
jgi:hypothetical protein